MSTIRFQALKPTSKATTVNATLLQWFESPDDLQTDTIEIDGFGPTFKIEGPSGSGRKLAALVRFEIDHTSQNQTHLRALVNAWKAVYNCIGTITFPSLDSGTYDPGSFTNVKLDGVDDSGEYPLSHKDVLLTFTVGGSLS